MSSACKSLLFLTVASLLVGEKPVAGQAVTPIPNPPKFPAQGDLVLPGSGAPVQIALPVVNGTLDTFTFNASVEGSSGIVYGWHASDPNSELLDFLSASRIQKQIEFSEEQQELFADFQRRLSTEYAAIRDRFPELKKKDLPQAERQKLNQTVMLEYNKLKKEFSKELEDSLVPQQVKLIEQLKFRQSVQMFGLTWTLTNGQFREAAEVSDEQKKELEKIKKESEEAIQQKIAEMRQQAKEKMLKVLDRKQKEKLREWEGDSDKTPISRL